MGSLPGQQHRVALRVDADQQPIGQRLHPRQHRFGLDGTHVKDHDAGTLREQLLLGRLPVQGDHLQLGMMVGNEGDRTFRSCRGDPGRYAGRGRGVGSRPKSHSHVAGKGKRVRRVRRGRCVIRLGTAGYARNELAA